MKKILSFATIQYGIENKIRVNGKIIDKCEYIKMIKINAIIKNQEDKSLVKGIFRY